MYLEVVVGPTTNAKEGTDRIPAFGAPSNGDCALAILLKKPRLQNAAIDEAFFTEPDELKGIIFKIENLDKEGVIALVGELEDAFHQTYFELGGALWRIRANGYFTPNI